MTKKKKIGHPRGVPSPGSGGARQGSGRPKGSSNPNAGKKPTGKRLMIGDRVTVTLFDTGTGTTSHTFQVSEIERGQITFTQIDAPTSVQPLGIQMEIKQPDQDL